MNEEKEDELEKAIINSLKKRITEEINKKYPSERIPYRLDKGKVVAATMDETDAKIVDYIVTQLAIKRFMYGLELKKGLEEW